MPFRFIDYIQWLTERKKDVFSIISFGFILYGAFLRIAHINHIQIFADEIHPLQVASEETFLWIATHFASNDACIPYTLYSKLLLNTVGLSELSFRLPAIFSGIALLPVIFWYAEKKMGRLVAMTSVIFMAVSPYFVYLSREARPYSIIMLLVTWAGFVLFDTRKRLPLLPLCFASGMLAIAVYCHPVVIPSTLVLWTVPLWKGLNGDYENRNWLKWYLIASLSGLFIGLVTFGSALPSFLEGMNYKGNFGQADWLTARNGLLLIHGLPIFIPVLGWCLFCSLGLLFCKRNCGADSFFVLLMLIVQLGAIYITQPQLDQISWVWLRYWIHLFPLLLVFTINGVVSLIIFRSKKITEKHELAVGIVIMVLVIAFTVNHMKNSNYGVKKEENYPIHPMVIMMNRMKSRDGWPLMDTYKFINENTEKNATLIESPRIYTFPLYGRYSLRHKRTVLTAGVGMGFAQKVIERNPGFKFKTCWSDVRKNIIKNPIYWIHHYNIKKELEDWSELIERDPYAQSQMASFEFSMKQPLTDTLFGIDAFLEQFSPMGGRLIYTDKYVKIFKINS